MEFSKRIKEMGYSPMRKLVPFADAAEKKGLKVYKLHIGQPDVKTPDSFFEGIKQFEEKIVKYANSRGVPELLAAFEKSYAKIGLDLKEENLLITHGGSEALMFTLATICDLGDEVLVPEPFYSNYDSFLKVADAHLVPIPTTFENGYHLPEKAVIEALITDKTKAIMFSNPCNPTGTVFTPTEMEMIADLAIENNLYIITDEVYRQFIYEDIPYQSFLEIERIRERTILVDSISKHYSACGARIGVIASYNIDFINQAMKLLQARLSVSTIEQYATANLLGTLDDYMDQIRLEYKVRRDLLYTYLTAIPNVSCIKPKSAFYIIAKLPVLDVEHFAQWLLTDFEYEGQTLMFAPGPGFYMTEGLGKQEARFSFCTHNLLEIERGIKVLVKGLETYQKLELNM